MLMQQLPLTPDTYIVEQYTTNLFSDFMPVACSQSLYSHRAGFVLSLNGALLLSCLSTHPRTDYIKILVRLKTVQKSFQFEGALCMVCL